MNTSSELCILNGGRNRICTDHDLFFLRIEIH